MIGHEEECGQTHIQQLNTQIYGKVEIENTKKVRRKARKKDNSETNIELQFINLLLNAVSGEILFHFVA